jgi:hypothetical protein
MHVFAAIVQKLKWTDHQLVEKFNTPKQNLMHPNKKKTTTLITAPFSKLKELSTSPNDRCRRHVPHLITWASNGIRHVPHLVERKHSASPLHQQQDSPMGLRAMRLRLAHKLSRRRRRGCGWTRAVDRQSLRGAGGARTLFLSRGLAVVMAI